jgi:hypothetical protein
LFRCVERFVLILCIRAFMGGYHLRKWSVNCLGLLDDHPDIMGRPDIGYPQGRYPYEH